MTRAYRATSERPELKKHFTNVHWASGREKPVSENAVYQIGMRSLLIGNSVHDLERRLWFVTISAKPELPRCP
jgi:hypothetical protein